MGWNGRYGLLDGGAPAGGRAFGAGAFPHPGEGRNDLLEARLKAPPLLHSTPETPIPAPLVDLVATLLDPALPDVAAAVSAARSTLVRLRATPYLARLDALAGVRPADSTPGLPERSAEASTPQGPGVASS